MPQNASSPSVCELTLDTLQQVCLGGPCAALPGDLPESTSAEAGLEAYCAAPEVLQGLFSYLTLLMKWNKVMNLVGPYNWQEALVTLIADSAHLAKFVMRLQATSVLRCQPECWDLGAGAGLPGLPLRLLWADGSYTLVDAREKRMLFLRTVLAAHPLPSTFVFQGRVEAFMPTRPCADMIVSRAFMPWEQLLGLVAPFLAPKGLVVFLALKPAPEEDMLRIGDFSWELQAEECYQAGADTRYLWAVSLKKTL